MYRSQVDCEWIIVNGEIGAHKVYTAKNDAT